MDEFELIRQYFSDLGQDSSGCVELGVGDDCAIVSPPPGQQLVFSIDTLVEGTHFLPDTPAQQIATRLLGATLSDLAAMGARPGFFTLALTLPESDPEWLAAFAEPLAKMAERHGVRLVGGDTTKGPLTLTVQVHGWVEYGRALRRDGACPGDAVYVTGTLGDSRAGLETLLQNIPHSEDVAYLQRRFFAPEPRLSTAQLLTGQASAAIDISDGLLADLQHVLSASHVGACIELEELPLSPALRRFAGEDKAVEWACSGGEDFEVCFTLPPDHEEAVLDSLVHHDVPVWKVGEIRAELGLFVRDAAGERPVTARGFNHFSEHAES
ncbi:thiamine-phosphate kinase [Aliamphritea hakodatensis]|uniref:thiamine-phosphate kinase n=1 Tax=Aliamphritea hakodatensis TaxID=2895352 RepID=UPI0022FD563D|nr:thiamine-phosphate kinase [Aliamphritea hakodatensis]